MSNRIELAGFRIASVVVPSLVTIGILFTFGWLFVVSSEGSPPATCGNSADGILIRSHIIPSGILSLYLLAFSTRLPLTKLRFQFVCSIVAVAITLVIIHRDVWLQRLVGGWWINVDIEPLLKTVPIFGTIAGIAGLGIGYLLASIWLKGQP